MSGLATLIRLSRRHADEKRVALADAERQTLLASEALREHDATNTRETERARGHAEDMALWSDWARVSLRQRGQLAMVVGMLQKQEAELREALRDNFAEIKRLEIALETAEAAANRKAQRKAEQAAEDAELRRPR
jgi:tRNA1(Val) A37 N6-methylase TrmN6